MAAAAVSQLRLCIVLCLLSWVLARRESLHDQPGQPASAAAVAVGNAVGGQCDAVLLSSLSTFVTSGVGYAAAAHQLGPARVLNSSSAAGGGEARNFDPTPPHKPLWPTWSQRDVWLFALSAVTLFIAAGGGIGGGAVFVPLFIIIGGFTAAQAVALSNITILGGAVANFIVNSTKRHAFRDAPLIDWDLIVVMEPTTMLGALLGSYANKLLPTWFTSCLMAALLVFLTYKLLMRGVSTFIHESHDLLLQRVQQQQQQHGPDDLSAPLLAHDHDQDAAAAAYTADCHLAAAAAGTRRGSSSSSSKHTQAAAAAGSGSAWMDLGPAGDQQSAHPARRSSRGGDAGSRDAGSRHSQQYNSRGSDGGDLSPTPADTDVVPVPPGLKPLTVAAAAEAGGTAAAAAVGAAGAEALQPEASHAGGRAFSVESTPRVAEHVPQQDGVTSPILWSEPSSATEAGAAAAAVAGTGCPFSQQALQKQQHQQQRRQALLLPRHSAGGHSSGTSSDEKQPSRVCCLCSCLDPSRLKLSTVQAYSRQQLPWQPVLVLFLLSCWVVASDTGKATLACGSLRYWAVVLSVVPPCLLVTLTVRQWLLARATVEAAAAAAVGSLSPCAGAAGQAAAAAGLQRPAASGTIHWTPRNSITYPLICSLAGVFAGLFGVGGGIVKGPLMLELGVLPDVAAATSATMIMFTAGSAAVVYLNFGGVVVDYAQALLLLGFVVTLAGQLVATHLVRVLKRRSVIVFAMGLLMLLASVAAVYQMGLSTAAAWQAPPMWRWGSICQHH